MMHTVLVGGATKKKERRRRHGGCSHRSSYVVGLVCKGTSKHSVESLCEVTAADGAVPTSSFGVSKVFLQVEGET